MITTRSYFIPHDTRVIIAVHGSGSPVPFERVSAHLPDDVQFKAIALPDAGQMPAIHSLTDYAVYLLDTVGAVNSPVILLAHGLASIIVLEYLQHFAATVCGVIFHEPACLQPIDGQAPGWRNWSVINWLHGQVRSVWLRRPRAHYALFDNPATIPAPYLDRFVHAYRQRAGHTRIGAMVTMDWVNGLQHAPVPATFLWGGRVHRPFAETIPQIRRTYGPLLPHSGLRVIHDWGAYPMVEHPDEYAAQIAAFAQTIRE